MFLEFFDLLCGGDITIIHLNGGVLLCPLTECGLRNAVFLAELGFCLAVLMKGDEGLLKSSSYLV